MKRFSVILSLVLIVSLLAGCAGTPVVYYADCTCPTNEGAVQEATQAATEATEAAPQPTEAPVTTQGALKTGLYIGTGVGESVNGEAKYDVTVAAVTVDENGIIVSCELDSLGTSIKFDESGVITTDLTTVPMTKNELGDAYNMKAYGGAAKEWYEQANAFDAACIGKTIGDIKSLLGENNYGTTDLQAAGCTILVDGFVKAASKIG